MLKNSSDLYQSNRFFFIIAAAKRAHALQENLATALVPTEPNEKSTVTALKELNEHLLNEDGSEPAAQ